MEGRRRTSVEPRSLEFIKKHAGRIAEELRPIQERIEEERTLIRQRKRDLGETREHYEKALCNNDTLEAGQQRTIISITEHDIEEATIRLGLLKKSLVRSQVDLHEVLEQGRNENGIDTLPNPDLS